MSTVFLGLGGNIGDSCRILLQALHLLKKAEHAEITAVSSLYKTPPWGKLDQPWFINACCSVRLKSALEEFFTVCQSIEKTLHRERVEKWGARTIDIDFLATEDGDLYHSDKLIIPHPFLTERAFILEPLAELVPKLVVKGQAIETWAQQNLDPRIQKVYSPEWELFRNNLL